jgi:putative transcriptional regulator
LVGHRSDFVFYGCHCEAPEGRRSNLAASKAELALRLRLFARDDNVDDEIGKFCRSGMTFGRLQFTALVLGAAALGAVAATADDAPPLADPPPGELLIASAEIQDPRFFHSVVLLVHHDGTGAFGIVINNPIGERPLAALLAGTDGKDATDGKDGPDAKDSAIEGTIRVFVGGPVEPTLGFVIHGADYRRSETLAFGDGLAMTASKEVLRDIGHHRGPAQYLCAFGYAGWGAGQLDAEIARHDWFTAPAEPALVFDAERGTVWEKALARRTREL